MSIKKKSLLAGGLISSAGILISKILGLVYVIPYNEILGSASNNAYYANAYNIYSYILNIAVAGLPFAISTLVAKYAAHEDYRMCLLVKKVSFYTMATLGVICAMLMVVFAYPLASSVVPKDGSIHIMKNVIIIMALAVFIIPILSSIRGFFNGVKEMEIYSVSQVVEQLVRIIFLLSASAIAVYLFDMKRVWAVYFGVLAASIAGFTTYYFVKFKGRHKEKEIEKLAKEQTVSANHSAKAIFKELIVIAIPFLLNAMFGYCDTVINMFNLKPGLDHYGKMVYDSVLNDAIFYKATKIIAIPMILAPGFSAAIIPYITAAKEENNIKLIKRNIIDCVNSVIYIALPLCLALALFAKPIMQVLFGSNETLAIDAFVLRWYSLEALCATIAPIFASIGMALGKRKQIVIITFLFALIKLIINYPLICFFGIGGMVISSAIAYAIFAYLILRVIRKDYKISWLPTIKRVIFMLTGLLGLYMVYLLANMLNIFNWTSNRFLLLIILGVVGILSMVAYFVVTALLKVPQRIFKISFKKRG